MKASNWRKALRQNGRKWVVGILLLDATIYLAALQPVQNKVHSLQAQYPQLRRGSVESREKIKQLEDLHESLSETGPQVKDFYTRYFYPRRRAFSRVSNVLRRYAGKAGVELERISYQLGEPDEESRRYLSVQTTTVADWAALLRFLHEVENAKEMILWEGLAIRTSSFPGLLSLQLNLGVYLRP